MKTFIIISTLVAMCLARPSHYVYPGVLPYITHDHVPVQRLYHTQDILGNYVYGYSSPLSTKHEVKTIEGVKGGYSYVDADGIVRKTEYIADDGGFKVWGSHLPVAVKPVEDTLEVAKAKSEHIALVKAAEAGYVKPIFHDIKPVGYTPEVTKARDEHFAAVKAAEIGHASVVSHVTPVHHDALVPVDGALYTPEVAVARIEHKKAHEEAIHGVKYVSEVSSEDDGSYRAEHHVGAEYKGEEVGAVKLAPSYEDGSYRAEHHVGAEYKGEFGAVKVAPFYEDGSYRAEHHLERILPVSPIVYEYDDGSYRGEHHLGAEHRTLSHHEGSHHHIGHEHHHVSHEHLGSHHHGSHGSHHHGSHGSHHHGSHGIHGIHHGFKVVYPHQFYY